jgi:hypothetical protein
MENAELIQQLQANAQMIESHLINIESGIQAIMLVAVGFFVWAVIKALYKLFGGIFFGGV